MGWLPVLFYRHATLPLLEFRRFFPDDRSFVEFLHRIAGIRHVAPAASRIARLRAWYALFRAMEDHDRLVADGKRDEAQRRIGPFIRFFNIRHSILRQRARAFRRQLDEAQRWMSAAEEILRRYVG